jgi:hypothetical protein
VSELRRRIREADEGVSDQELRDLWDGAQLEQEDGRHEIDVVAELGGGRIVATEVKATAAPRTVDATHLARLRDGLGDGFVAGLVLRSGRAE